jgi:hypothetical protein
MRTKTNFKNSFWTLVISPVVWALHMLSCYIIAAVWCAKAGRDASLQDVRIVIFILTLLALIPVLYRMVKSYEKHKMGDSNPPHNAATSEDRERFLGLASLLISGLSALAILFIAFNAVIFRTCQ